MRPLGGGKSIPLMASHSFISFSPPLEPLDPRRTLFNRVAFIFTTERTCVVGLRHPSDPARISDAMNGRKNENITCTVQRLLTPFVTRLLPTSDLVSAQLSTLEPSRGGLKPYGSFAPKSQRIISRNPRQ